MSVSVRAAPGFPVRYQGSTVSSRVASSPAPGTRGIPATAPHPLRQASPSSSFGGFQVASPSQIPEAQGCCVVGSAQMRQPPGWVVGTSSPQGTRNSSVMKTVPSSRSSVPQRVPPGYMPNVRNVQPAVPASVGGSVTLPPRRTANTPCITRPADNIARSGGSVTVSPRHFSTSPCRTRQACSIARSGGSVTVSPRHFSVSPCRTGQACSIARSGGSVTLTPRRSSASPGKAKPGCSITANGASHLDGQMLGASISTIASDGSTLTSAAGSSITANDLSQLDTSSFDRSVSSVATGAATESLQAVEDEEPDNMRCTVVARKNDGLPLIWRLENRDTGKVQTIVEHEDGSIKAFGDSTISSIEKADEAKTLKYVDSLADIDLRGFVHEVEQRVTRSFRIYEKKQRELEELLDEIERKYFGIEKDATKSDLDKAYRKLARKMHPDKNGGTEYAKQAFQHMFERYKRLRCKCRESVNEVDMSMQYVNRLVLRACAKEDKGVKCFVDRLSAKCLRRASTRQAAKEIEPEACQSLAQHTQSQCHGPEKTPDEDFASRSYLEKQVKILIKKYKTLHETLSQIDQDLDRLHATKKQ